MPPRPSFSSLEGEIFDREHSHQLAVRLQLLPYATESEEQSNALLETFIAKTIAATNAKDVEAVVQWGVEAMQEWSVLRRSISRQRRAVTVRFFYYLTLVPGLKRKHMRSFLRMIRQLTILEGDGRRLLDTRDLSLDWRPLWQRLKGEIHTETTTVAQLVELAYMTKEYFSPDDTPQIMEEILPSLNPETPALVACLLSSFLPTSKPSAFLPLFFQMAEGFNSILMWLYMLELISESTERHMIFSASDSDFRDVGMFTQDQWQLLISKILTGYASQLMPFDALLRSDRQGSLIGKLRKPQYQPDAIALVIIYSMSKDGPVRLTPEPGSKTTPSAPGYLAGSKALDSLAQFVTSKELLFHPSQNSAITRQLTALTESLSRRFVYRWTEEASDTCKTPQNKRLTMEMKRAFVELLCTPVLMAIFSKDGDTAARARATLRSLAYLEPGIIMPPFLERAYNGLEAINETHRTTAVLHAMAEVALPLASEDVWFGGQKHILPLLELCLPGIDLNDPVKTVATASFLTNILMTVPIVNLVGKDEIGDVPMSPILGRDGELNVGASEDREAERTMVVESTSLFEDWVMAFFDRCLTLYEALPEEGGRSKRTGGKQEEAMLSGLREATDVICTQLSEDIFDSLLNRIYDFAITNTKLNSMKAFCQLLRRIARIQPAKSLAKFIPHCVRQIETELEHGAASIPTTSTLDIVHGDTALLWNLSLLQAALQEAGKALLPHKETLLTLLRLLVEKIKSERSYSLTGSIVKTVLYSLTAVYPSNRQSLNEGEWKRAATEKSSHRKWGKFYEGHEVQVDWHVPTDEEVNFALEILQEITNPAMLVVQQLIDTPAPSRDKIWRNDFCRYINVVTSSWRGLDTLISLQGGDSLSEAISKEYDVPELQQHPFRPLASLCLTDPRDPRYGTVIGYREHLGNVLHAAAGSLRAEKTEDHTDAVSALITAVDTYLFHHGIKDETARRKRSGFDSGRRAWVFSRRQYDMPRNYWTKFAECDHHYRLQHLARCKPYNEIDKLLVLEILEFCRSPYVKIRRNAQNLAQAIAGVSDMHSEYVVTRMMEFLQSDSRAEKGDKSLDFADRIKGSLHTIRLGNLPSLAVNNPILSKLFFISLLGLQYHDKNSIQALTATVFDLGIHALRQEVPIILPDDAAVTNAINDLTRVYPTRDMKLEASAREKLAIRFVQLNEAIQSSFLEILDIAQRPSTHWKYAQMALNALTHMRSREIVPPASYVRYLTNCTIHTHPTIRSGGRNGLDMVFYHVQIRTYCQTPYDLWTAQGHCPLHREIQPKDTPEFVECGKREVTPSNGELYFDGTHTFCYGWVIWGTVFGHLPQTGKSPFKWHESSQPMLNEVREVLRTEGYFAKLIEYYAEEPNVDPTNLDTRDDCVRWIHRICEIYGAEFFKPICDAVEPLWQDENRFKQRACLEVFSGLVAGSKHWNKEETAALWEWIMERWPTIYQNLKPDTLFWESFISWCFTGRDPRRSQPMIDWLFSLDWDLGNDSAFTLRKQLRFLANFYHAVAPRYYLPHAERMIKIMFDNINTPYEVAQRYIALIMGIVIQYDWQPSYQGIGALMKACSSQDDIFQTRVAPYRQQFLDVTAKLSQWRKSRLPPPHSLQSDFDRGASTIMQMMMGAISSTSAYIYLPYLQDMLPELLQTVEITDNPMLTALGTGITRMILSVSLPTIYIRPLFKSLVDMFQTSLSWRVRQRSSSMVSAIFLRYLERWSDIDDIPKILEVMLASLEDENVEVRSSASMNLALVIRSSMQNKISSLQKRFTRQTRKLVLPSRSSPDYEKTMRQRHGAVLGLIALARSYPFTVPEWMPPLIEILSKYATEPTPISNSIRSFGQEFQQNHQDNWHADSKLFNEDQTLALSTIVSGTSYFGNGAA
ncbi:hypothetical protein CPB86DRAFT_822639 [Serendipita vermifera]|nr:hypothetical protein CPB86DRAFT_822639 [Serendipita vermifera]